MQDEKGHKLNQRRHILEKAESLINGDRADLYGPPEVSFGRIAALLNAMGWRRIDPLDGAVELNAVDVSLGLTQLKISRIISERTHEDSWADAAGYIALGAELALGNDQLYPENVGKAYEPAVLAPSEEPMIHFWRFSQKKFSNEPMKVQCDGCMDVISYNDMQKHMNEKHSATQAYISPPSPRT